VNSAAPYSRRTFFNMIFIAGDLLHARGVDSLLPRSRVP
jgi:hypothetical protein